MNRQQLKDEIIFKLTGGVLRCELDAKSLDMLINSAMRKLQTFYDSTKIITIPYSRCIDMKQYKVNAVARVFRSVGYTTDTDTETNQGMVIDPMQASQWQLLSGTGNLYNYQDYAYNYASWNTLLQIRNTTSTDLIFRYDRTDDKLYINVSTNQPDKITIEYVPRLYDVEEIVSDYWIEKLTELCVCMGKQALGRIRTRYVQTGALYTQDGQTMLDEGNSEYNALMEELKKNSQLCYPID